MNDNAPDAETETSPASRTSNEAKQNAPVRGKLLSGRTDVLHQYECNCAESEGVQPGSWTECDHVTI